MGNAHCSTWSTARKQKIMENEKQKLQDVKYGEKQRKKSKMRNEHCRTWNMARKLENLENETQTQFELEYGKKHSKT